VTVTARFSLAAALRGLAAIVVAGAAITACGGSEQPPPEPKIPAGLARDFAAQAEAIAANLDAGDPCQAREQALALQADVDEAIASGRIPAAFRRELRSTVNELVQIECLPPEPPPEEEDPCAALEERKEQLDEEKKALHEEIEDEEERKAREQEIEAEKKAVEEQLKECEEAEKDDD
jgi:hypothetical protein